MSFAFPAPDGTEAGPPDGLDRHESVHWWGMWKLARAATHNTQGAGAVAYDNFILNPTKKCPEACDAGVTSDELTGQLATCPTCQGLGYVRMTLEEIRDEYRAIQQRVCEDYGLSESEFNTQAARTAVRDGGEPGYWLHAARGVETKKARERAERKREARARW